MLAPSGISLCNLSTFSNLLYSSLHAPHNHRVARSIRGTTVVVLDFQVTCGPVQLRLLTPRHAHALFSLCRDPLLSRHLQWHPHSSIEDSLEYIRDARALWHRQRAYLLGTFHKGELIGSTGIFNIDQANRCAEVGSWIGRPFQGRGWNLPAKGAVFALGFDVLKLSRLELLIRTDNVASVRATRRLPGVRDEGILHARIQDRDDPTRSHDAHCCALTRFDWLDAAPEYPTVDIRGQLPPSFAPSEPSTGQSLTPQFRPEQ